MNITAFLEVLHRPMFYPVDFYVTCYRISCSLFVSVVSSVSVLNAFDYKTDSFF